MGRLRQRKEWQFLASLRHASPALATGWWSALVLRSVLPAVFTVSTGVLIAAVEQHRSLALGLVLVGISFVGLQVLSPLNTALSANLGSRVAAWLYDRVSDACVGPPGLGHLEDPGLAEDLIVAREFDLGMTGPPMHINMDFIAGGMVDLGSGMASAVVLFAYRWWAPVIMGLGWGSTHWLLRESSVWRDRNTDEVRRASRHSDYAYRMAVDPPAAKELRLFGLAGWTLERFIQNRRTVFTLQYQATRLREKSVLSCLVLVLGANLVVLVSLASSAWAGHLDLGRLVVFAQAAVGTGLIGFGGISWAFDGASAPVAAVARLEPAMAEAGRVANGAAPADGRPATNLRLRDLRFSYPRSTHAVLEGVDLVVPAGTSMAIVGQNGAGKTTLAKLICRMYDPTGGAIEADGTDVRELDVDSWRRQVTAVFQDFVRYELPLRDNVAPAGAPDEVIRAALADAGADALADLDVPLSRAYPGGTDLSGGQWQRVALARALCAVRTGARLVLLDEPTAQLDVRGEAAIFERVLEATRGVTTLLISHRFSTVRRADRICVIEGGQVIELGSHDELMAAGGRYRTMFDLQARRFTAAEDEEGHVYDVLA